MTKETISLSDEKQYLDNLKLISLNCLYSEVNQERFEKVNNIWYLQPDDTEIPQEPGQKLDLIVQKLTEELEIRPLEEAI